MRTALACFVLAAAIATPGIVVAAMSSGGHGSVFFGSSTTVGIVTPIHTGHIQSRPIDPALRPAVRAVKQAFAARGIQLIVQSAGPGSAEAFDLTASTGCPTFIIFRTTSQGSASFAGSCSGGQIRTKAGTIDYSPASIEPTVRQAVAGLR